MLSLPDWAPNVHPLLVHFPIGLLFAAVLVDVAALVARRAPWLRRTAATLYVLGAVGALATFLSGREAAEHGHFSAAATAILGEHEEWAERTLWTFGLLALVRLVAELRGLTTRVAVHLPLALAGLLGLLMLSETGEHGAQLVFQQGVGVAAHGDANTPPDTESH